MLDSKFYPMYLYQRDFLEAVDKQGNKSFGIACERENGAIKVYKTRVANICDQSSIDYIERIVKTMLWAYGGYRIYLQGDDKIAEAIASFYKPDGKRAFDCELMEQIYLKPLEVISVSQLPKEHEISARVGGDFKGKRIGFDAGGSDRKVTATLDGEVVFAEETIWLPKVNSDTEYHKAGISHSIDLAMPYLDKLDAIGVSTAGIVVNDEIRVSSLFRMVPKEQFNREIIPIYKNLAKKYNCPVKVANDGDIAALAGALDLNCGKVVGVAMGTSLAAGYVDEHSNIRGYINELAFVPVDANKDAAVDEWSGDYGVGVMYMSQDAVIKLMEEANIEYDRALTPASKLVIAQNLVNSGDDVATEIFKRVGEYFGYSIMWYSQFYDISNVIFLGRVASGRGGELVVESAGAILQKYSNGTIAISMPDEKSRRLGQSYFAASLVNL